MAQTDNVVSTVQIFEKGVHNNLHLHLVEDGYWIILGGRARFHGPGDEIIGEFEQYEGVLLPAGTRYWFEGISDEPLQILRVNYRVHAGPRRVESNGQIREEDAPTTPAPELARS